MILAIGNSSAHEVEAFTLVTDTLKRWGHDAILFKQDKCLDGEYLIFEVQNNKPRYLIIVDGKEYDVETFSALWYLKPHLPRPLLNYEPAEYRPLVQKQFEDMRRALWSLFQHKKWIDNPWQMLIAENKLYQLKIATSVGLHVPETLITSDPERVRSFYQHNEGNVVVKLLGASPLLSHVVYTNVVTPEHMVEIDSVKMSPSIFQARVPKAYELRITVVGNKIFPVKIYSQEDTETAVDWRRKPKFNDFAVKMETTTLPEDVTQRIWELVKRVGLRLMCIDMIVTPTGEHVFLEINPNGQWYFVQMKTNLQIADAIADLLV